MSEGHDLTGYDFRRARLRALVNSVRSALTGRPRALLAFAAEVAKSGILHEFPGRTPTDLYLWIMDHLHYLKQAGQSGLGPAEAAVDFIQAAESGELDVEE